MIDRDRSRRPVSRNSGRARVSDSVDPSANSARIGTWAKIVRTEFVGGQVGKELATDGTLALLVVCLGVMVYLAFRFEWRFAVATIIANLHDVVIILGMFAAFQWEFSLPVLAAVLAILGYSVNESVVVFPGARELPQDAPGTVVAYDVRAETRRALSLEAFERAVAQGDAPWIT